MRILKETDFTTMRINPKTQSIVSIMGNTLLPPGTRLATAEEVRENPSFLNHLPVKSLDREYMVAFGHVKVTENRE